MDILGFGNPMMDVTTTVDDHFIQTHGLKKSAMEWVTLDRSNTLLTHMKDPQHNIGGSCVNTMVAFASLGGHAAFVGGLAQDDMGQRFVDDFNAQGVNLLSPPQKREEGTARCLIFVTPDTERTLQTYGGACQNFNLSELDKAKVEAARIVYIEGYVWDSPTTREVAIKLAEIAQSNGATVAFTLSDTGMVERHLRDFQNFIGGYVDILFANEAEAETLAAGSKALQHFCPLIAITRNDRGSLILSNNETLAIDPVPVARPLDSTGAGDFYAAGFLFGHSRGHDLITCGRYGSVCASEVISHLGTSPKRPLLQILG